VQSRKSRRHQEIAADLQRRISEGEFPPGTNLPPYEELSESYGAGLATIRTALLELKAAGLVRSVPRVGVIVREPVEAIRVKRGNLVTRDDGGYVFPSFRPGEPWQVHELPRGTGPKVANQPVPSEIAEHLDITPGTDTLRRRRVTSPVGEPPFQLADTWIHPDAVADAPRTADRNTGPGGYLDRLEEAGHGPLSWQEIARVRLPDHSEARALKIAPSFPVLELTRVGTSARTGQAVEVTVSVIPGDRVEIVTDLVRDESASWPVTPAPGVSPEREDTQARNDP
jgi:GntR family transcriptional regulator